MKQIVLLFFLGLVLGFFLEDLFSLKPTKLHRSETTKRNNVKNLWQNQTKDKNEITVEDVKKIRILCFLNTMPKNHATRAVNVFNTWGKHCDKLIFASTLTDINIGAIGLNVSDDHDHMWGKEKFIMQYVYKNFINDYDWFFKGDDDTFALVENLKYLVSSYSPEDPIYFGYLFNTTVHKRGFSSGGSGYVMSRQTVRIFVEKVLVNPEFYRNGTNDLHDKLCHIETDDRIEDMEISTCFEYYDVYPGDERDIAKRGRFFIFSPEEHIMAKPNFQNTYWTKKYFWNDEGLDCCSNYTIAFHYIRGEHELIDTIHTLYFLSYRLKPYGIIPRLPPIPRRYDFADMKRMLTEQIANKTLRGY